MVNGSQRPGKTGPSCCGNAMHETGSACSRKIFSSVKPDCVRFEKGWALATSLLTAAEAIIKMWNTEVSRLPGILKSALFPSVC
jgi:hypothetical protein